MTRRIISGLLMLILLIGMIPMAVISASAASDLTTSENAIQFIKDIEGFTSKAYWDNSQWSIGYGTSSSKGATITKKQADKALRKALVNIDKAINEFAKDNNLKLTQEKHDALASLSYNCGTGWMKQSGRLQNAILKGKKGNDFLFAISLWANSGSVPEPGLIKRRMCEAYMYLSGKYTSSLPSKYTYVIFDPNGGVAGTDGEDKMQGYKLGSDVEIKVANPTKSGAKFKGWYTAPSGGTKVTVLNASTAGKVLYAHWSGAAEKPIASGTVQCDTYVNIRSGAGTGYQVVSKAVNGTKLDIYEYKTVAGTKWGRVAAGWISMEYVKVSSESGSSSSEVIDTGKVSGIKLLPVRYGPSKKTDKVKTLTRGTAVKIYETKMVKSTQWGRIGTNRWVNMKYVTLDTGNSNSAKVTGTVSSKTKLNIRSAPGVQNKAVGSLSPGTQVTILEQKNVNGTKWGRLSSGWVCMDYIKLN